MPTTVVSPDGTNSGAANFTITGAANAHTALSDNSDASYVQKSNSVTGTATLQVGFGTTTISATSLVRRVRLRGRVRTDNANGKIDLMIGTRVNGVTSFFSGYAVRGSTGGVATDVTGAWFTASPDGASWDQVRIDALRAQVIEYRDTTDRGYVYELDIDVDTATQPTVSVTAPTGTVTTTASPDVAWTYTDPDAADPQAYYEVRVFTAAQYGVGGFDAATSTATWESGQVASTEAGVTIGALLLSGTYRAYVRLAKSINSQPFWSTWAYSQFTVSLTPPPVVSVNAAWSASEGKATLTLTGGAAGGSYTSQFFEVQRSDDAGVTWALVRNGTGLAPNGSYVATALDYEAPRGVTVRYRARSVGVIGEFQIPSAWSGTIPQVLVTNDGTWWLKAVASPSLNVGSLRVQKALSVKVEEPLTVFRPIGSSKPIVVAGVIGGQDGSIEIVTNGDTEWDAVEAILLHQGTLLMQDPTGRQKYIRVTSRSWDESYSASRIVRTASVDFVEVDG